MSDLNASLLEKNIKNKRAMGRRKCSVKDCSSDTMRHQDIGVTFHKLPSRIDIRQKWIDLCHVEEPDKKMTFVCSRHFLKADFCNYKSKFVLKQCVLPTVFPWTKKDKANKQEKSETTAMPTAEPETQTVENTESETPTNARSKSGRIRKKKLNPDYLTNEDFKRRERVVDKDKDKISDKPGGTGIDSEGSMSDCNPDSPPVLEPQDLLQPEDGATGDGVENEAKIPQLEPSTGEKFVDKSNKTKDKKDKKKVTEKDPKDKTKEKDKIKKPLSPSTGVASTPTNKNASMIKDKIVVEEKCSPRELKSLEMTSSSEHYPIPETPTTIKQDQDSHEEKPIKPEQVMPPTSKLIFEPNTRIEALDFNQTWSPATILEVDYEENEVLVHFDSYSNKYDEWIGINSSSIRAPGSGVELKKEITYEVGERCLAHWSDAKNCPVLIKEVVDHETYVVEFEDGYIKTMNQSKLLKDLNSESPEVPVRAPKRSREGKGKKRKLNVQSLFKKRTKKTVESSFVDENSSADEGPTTTVDIWYPSFENGHLVGKPGQFMTKKGFKDTVIVPDPTLPPAWEKHIMPREPNCTAKWMCVIVTPDGKKLRSRIDGQRYIKEHPDFNTSLHRLDFVVIPRSSRSLPASSTPKDKNDAGEYAEAPPSPPKVELLKILQVDGGFQCPIDGCGKNFRRENLVQMHVKHYHPEFIKYLDSTPNVFDLVYQRLHGDDFEQSPSRSYSATASENKRASQVSLAPEETANDCSLFEQTPKDPEIKKLLNSGTYDSGSEAGAASSTGSEYAENKFRNVSADSGGPDLKALAVTTKSGLKTIPPLKKSSEPRDEYDASGQEGRKRKFEDLGLGGDGDDHDGNSSTAGEGEFLMRPQSNMDHIIGEDGKVIKIEHMRKEEIINCTCGITEEDGLMIQCEICMCWQHAHCNSIYREIDVPEKYVCYICQHPVGQRNSKRFIHDQDWLKLGTMPTGSYHCRDDEANRERFDKLKDSHDISGGLLELKDYMHSLQLKIKIAEVKNHPKLYLWSKPWDKNALPEKRKLDSKDIKPKEESLDVEVSTEPQPEAAIETVDCRVNLLEHIAHCQALIEERLGDFEKKINEMDPNPSLSDAPDQENLVRMTTSMLVRDLSTLKEFSQFSSF